MIQKINIVIVDDDELCINPLIDSLNTFENINIIGAAKTALHGKKLIIEHQPSLVFLDIELPDLNGLDLLRELNATVNWGMHVVFYTAYDNYLLEALRHSVFDYLLKPLDRHDLEKVMKRFFTSYQKNSSSTFFSDEVNRITLPSSVIMVTTVDGFRMLHLDQVGYFSYMNDKKRWAAVLSDLTEVHLKKGTTATDILNYSNSFMRINRDQIINIQYLSIVKGKECILFPPFDGVKDLITNGKFIGLLQERFSLM